MIGSQYQFSCLLSLNDVVLFCHINPQSHRHCFNVYEVRLESVEQERGGSKHFQPEVIESDQSIPTVSSDGTLTLYVTTTSTLSTNTLYRATLITAMDMMEAGSIQFCKFTVTNWFLFQKS